MSTPELVTMAEAHSAQEVIINADRPPLTVLALSDLYRYREVMWAFAKRHVKIKYKQMSLGVGWAVVQPLLATLIVSLVLGHFGHVGSEGVSYIPFAMTGMVLWTFFSGAVMFALDSVLRDQGFLRKLYFPREILPISSVLAFLVDLGPGILVLLVLVLIEGIGPHWSLLLLPLPVLLIGMAALALGMATAALNVFFRDLRFLMPFVIQLGLLVTPVAYSAQLVPAHWRTLYLALNPVGEAIDATRLIVLHGVAPDWSMLALAFLSTCILLAGSYALFKSLDWRFVELL